MQKIKVIKTPETNIKEHYNVKVTKTNHIIEVKHSTGGGIIDIRKLSKTQYLRISTGEILDYDLSENKAQAIQSVRRTLHRLRTIINANFTGGPSELMITVTYHENMTDHKRLYQDAKKFNQKLKRRYPNIESITVAEPHERGAWHLHILIKDANGTKLYIPDKLIKELWTHGIITKVQRLQDVDNIGAYLTAYLTDLQVEYTQEMDDNPEIEVKKIDGKSKAFIKGERLKLYPPGMNLYRTTKGIIKPQTETIIYKDIKKIVGNRQPHYQQTTDVYDQEEEEIQGKLVNKIQYQQYNLKRVPTAKKL